MISGNLREERKIAMNERASAWREKIVELLREVEDVGRLEYLHTFIILFIEKWGC